MPVQSRVLWRLSDERRCGRSVEYKSMKDTLLDIVGILMILIYVGVVFFCAYAGIAWTR